jgi:hypothetical protein
MRQRVCLLAALAAVSASAGAASTSASPPPDLGKPDPTGMPAPSLTVTSVLVEAPHRIPIAEVPGLGAPAKPGMIRLGDLYTVTHPDSLRRPSSIHRLARTRDCGACINSCWAGTTRTGPSDWSGHAWIYHHFTWCGNGAWITYGSAWQSIDQYGWYTIDGQWGPWWSGGCLGCSNLQVQGYITWHNTIPLIGFNQSGTTWLTTTLWAWGSIN